MGNKQSGFIYDSKDGASDSPYSSVPHADMVYRVNALKHFFEVIQDSPTKQRLLNNRVLSGNFVVKKPWYLCCQAIVTQTTLNQRRVDLTLRECFDLINITDDCEIGISYATQSGIQNLTRWEKYNPHSPLHHPSSPFSFGPNLGYVREDNSMPVLQL